MTSPSNAEKAAPAKRGLLGRAIHAVASLRLAVVLLITFAIVCIVATFLEAFYWGTPTVQWYIYDATWFVVLSTVLGVNILAALMVRIPWKVRHLGFVMAHIGVLVLLIGSLVTYIAGIEGQVSFAEGETSDSILMYHRSQLSIRHQGAETNLGFEPGPVDWRPGNTLDFGETDGIGLKILQFISHAQPESHPSGKQKTTFVSDDSKDSKDSKLQQAVLVELTAGDDRHEFWLQRHNPRHSRWTANSASGPIMVSFGIEMLPLGYSVKLLDFERGVNPGRMGNASFASTVQLIDTSQSIDRTEKISMNHPLTHGKFTFYQSGFNQLPGGREASTLSVAYDPGRPLKYVGCLLICVGIFVIYYVRPFIGRKPAAQTDAND